MVNMDVDDPTQERSGGALFSTPGFVKLGPQLTGVLSCSQRGTSEFVWSVVIAPSDLVMISAIPSLTIQDQLLGEITTSVGDQAGEATVASRCEELAALIRIQSTSTSFYLYMLCHIPERPHIQPPTLMRGMHVQINVKSKLAGDDGEWLAGRVSSANSNLTVNVHYANGMREKQIPYTRVRVVSRPSKSKKSKSSTRKGTEKTATNSASKAASKIEIKTDSPMLQCPPNITPPAINNIVNRSPAPALQPAVVHHKSPHPTTYPLTNEALSKSLPLLSNTTNIPAFSADYHVMPTSAIELSEYESKEGVSLIDDKETSHTNLQQLFDDKHERSNQPQLSETGKDQENNTDIGKHNNILNISVDTSPASNQQQSGNAMVNDRGNSINIVRHTDISNNNVNASSASNQQQAKNETEQNQESNMITDKTMGMSSNNSNTPPVSNKQQSVHETVYDQENNTNIGCHTEVSNKNVNTSPTSTQQQQSGNEIVNDQENDTDVGKNNDISNNNITTSFSSNHQQSGNEIVNDQENDNDIGKNNDISNNNVDASSASNQQQARNETEQNQESNMITDKNMRTSSNNSNTPPASNRQQSVNEVVNDQITNIHIGHESRNILSNKINAHPASTQQQSGNETVNGKNIDVADSISKKNNPLTATNDQESVSESDRATAVQLRSLFGASNQRNNANEVDDPNQDVYSDMWKEMQAKATVIQATFRAYLAKHVLEWLRSRAAAMGHTYNTDNTTLGELGDETVRVPSLSLDLNQTAPPSLFYPLAQDESPRFLKINTARTTHSVAVTNIQRVYRGHLGKRYYLYFAQLAEQNANGQTSSKAENKVLTIVTTNDNEVEGDLIHTAAADIQRVYRGYLGKRCFAYFQLQALDTQLAEQEQNDALALAILEHQEAISQNAPSNTSKGSPKNSVVLAIGHGGKMHAPPRESPSHSPSAHGTAGAHGVYSDQHNENSSENSESTKRMLFPPNKGQLSERDDFKMLLSGDVVRTQLETTNKLRMMFSTWNMGCSAPPGEGLLAHWFKACAYHVVAVGLQESTASLMNSLVLPVNKQKWERNVGRSLGDQYVMIKSLCLVQMHLGVWVHVSLLPFVSHVEKDTVSTGAAMPGKKRKLGNKGAVGISFRLMGKHFLFVNAHLKAHRENALQRNVNFHEINARMKLPGGVLHREPLVERFDHTVFMGDLNYRVDMEPEEVHEILRKDIGEPYEPIINPYDHFGHHDQLANMMRSGAAFKGYSEMDITFAPTYKLKPGLDIYNAKRTPSYTDRILWGTSEHVSGMAYHPVPDVRTSDHNPVQAILDFGDMHADPGRWVDDDRSQQIAKILRRKPNTPMHNPNPNTPEDYKAAQGLPVESQVCAIM